MQFRWAAGARLTSVARRLARQVLSSRRMVGDRSSIKPRNTPSSCCRRDEACDPFHAVGGEMAARERARSTWRSEPARASSGGVARMRLHTGAFGLLELGELLDGRREQGFMHVMMEAGRAESDCKTRQQRATPHPCARAWRCEGLRPLPLPCWAGTPRALPVTARRRQHQKYLPPSFRRSRRPDCGASEAAVPNVRVKLPACPLSRSRSAGPGDRGYASPAALRCLPPRIADGLADPSQHPALRFCQSARTTDPSWHPSARESTNNCP